jgi:outer membrane protein assembly factor BamE
MPKFLAAFALAAALSGCGVVYKVDVYQGNLLKPENVEQLRPGLNKRQVLELLGSPAVADPFHQSRWDYVSTVAKRGGEPEIHSLVLTFDGELLASIEGDTLTEDSARLMRDMRRYGNLPREERNKRRAGQQPRR